MALTLKPFSSLDPSNELATLPDRVSNFSSNVDSENNTVHEPQGLAPQSSTSAKFNPPQHSQASSHRNPGSDDHRPSLVQDSDEHNYPKPFALALLLLGTSVTVFVVALDRTIVATAIPRITDDFHSPDDVGWYGSVYLLTSCAFQPIYGRVFSHFDVRWSFLSALGLFELGSLICGVAPSSVVLIVGRAIAGMGCAGVFAGALVIIAVSMPLEKRPVYTALVGSIFGIGAICGPVIGGALTSQATWRWCFYLNLPVGAITFMTLVFFFHPSKRPALIQESFWQRILNLDLMGNLLIIIAIIMLLLALQWGGTAYAWSDSVIIGLLVGAGLVSLVFFGWQYYRGDSTLIPPKLVSQRTVAASFSTGFFLSGALLVHSYYLPYWFQAIRERTAIESGVDTIPYLASNFLWSVMAGTFVSKVGYYVPPALLGGVIATIGCGLLTTLTLDTGTAHWVGYEVLTGAGLGMAIQQGVVAVQAVVALDVIPIATTLVVFAQSLAGAIFVAVGNTILRNGLKSGLRGAKLSDEVVTAIMEAGATEARKVVPAELVAQVLIIYNEALRDTLTLAVPLAGLGLISSGAMQWKNLKKA